MLSTTQLAALQEAANSGVACELATQVPAELTVSQWAIESGWGAHQPGNNCFGIKAYEGCSDVQTLETIEYIHGVSSQMPQQFAAFSSLDLCFQKHACLISEGRPYAKAWAQYLASPNLETLIQQIAPVYSTSPNYAKELLIIIGMDEVKSSLADARNAVQPSAPAINNA